MRRMLKEIQRKFKWFHLRRTAIVLNCIKLTFLSIFLSENVAGVVADNNKTISYTKCRPGLVLPVWYPQENLTVLDRLFRGMVYLSGMAYMFIGVSIVSDRFMASIEVITSKEKELHIQQSQGGAKVIVVRVWNETVANLTLMALGSSAPEILLSAIEVYARNFEAGELGPGTIVGSAAFNLLWIIAICNFVIPEGEVRRIKHLRVFLVTASWSIFAYVWMVIALKIVTPGVVDLWEALLTFAFFPLTVGTAYFAEKKGSMFQSSRKSFRLNKHGIIVEAEGHERSSTHRFEKGLKVFEEEGTSEEIKKYEDSRRDYIRIFRDLRKNHANLGTEELEKLAMEEIWKRGPKSIAFYRMQSKFATPGMLRKSSQLDLDEIARGDKKNINDANTANVVKVYFHPGHYIVHENVGQLKLTISRDGGDPTKTVLVDYATEDGTAHANVDYKKTSGTLTFHPRESSKTVVIQIIDDDTFEEDEYFYVRLSNPRFSEQNPRQKVVLGTPFLATVVILDDDHCGIFAFPEWNFEVAENVGTYEFKVSRWTGARGRVLLPYETEDGTAKSGKDYEHAEGTLIFENDEMEKFITVKIIEEDSYQKDVLFYVNLKNPELLEDFEGVPLVLKHLPRALTEKEQIAMKGWPRLGEHTSAQIRIKESKEFKSKVDKIVQKANNLWTVGTSSWKEQFVEALDVTAGLDEGEENSKNQEGKIIPSLCDYIIHFLTVFWKVIFAFVPPTVMLGGWISFVASITGIGLLTGIIGDLASHLGCSIGIDDTVTAILFVAIGTSVPDTFASKLAAIQDEYADASVGNVTGSNAVNVFLGIGIAWTMSAVYHEFIKSANCKKGEKIKENGKTTLCRKFNVEPGNVVFSVTVFCSVAVVAVLLMVIRRHPKLCGGELGGPFKLKLANSIIFICLWFFYVTISTLETYGIV